MPLSRRLLLPLVLALLAAARPAGAVCTAAQVMACGNNCWTCVGSRCTIAKLLPVTPPTPTTPCTFDFGTRDIVLASGGFTSGDAAFEIRAHGLTVGATGTLKATGNQLTPGGIITLTLGAGGFHVLASANLIDLTGSELLGSATAGGGTLTVQSDGDVTIDGPGIAVDGTTPNAQGGNLQITAGRYVGTTLAAAGNILLTGPISATAKVNGAGGNVTLVANGGTVDVENRIQVDGGVNGGSITTTSDRDTTLGTIPTGGPLLQADGTGDAGSGGCIDVFASGKVVGKNAVTGRVLARGSNAFVTTNGGGCGGMISIEATRPLALGGGSNGGIDASGGQLGFGGSICLMTDTPGADLTLGVPLAAGAAGLGSGGGCIDVCSAGRALIQDDIDASGDCGGAVCVGALSDLSLSAPAQGIHADGGGSIDLCAGGLVTLAGPLLSANESSLLTGSPGGSVSVLTSGSIGANGPIDVSAAGPNPGGSIDIEAGKDLVVPASATLNADGGRTGGQGGALFLFAGVPDLPGNLTLDGPAHATGTSAPNTPGPALGSLGACTIHVGATGILDTRGDALAENTLVARKGITVDPGALIATTGGNAASRNLLTLPTGASTPNPGAFTPALAPTDVQFHQLCTGPDQPPGCLDACPTCGNGQIEFPETCDNGAANGACQPCSATCRTIDCNDNNPCTTDTCDVLTGCMNTPIPGCTTTTTTLPTTTTSSTVAPTSTTVIPTTSTTVVVTTTTTISATLPPTTSTTGSTSTSTTTLPTTTTTTTAIVTSSTTSTPTTTVTTITTSSTTSTTQPTGCTAGPTFPSIDCRLDLLIGEAHAADLGRLKPGLLRRLDLTKGRTKHAEELSSGGHESTARHTLGGALSSLTTFEQRLQSNNGRRIVPGATRAALLAMADSIHADLQSLLKSL